MAHARARTSDELGFRLWLPGMVTLIFMALFQISTPQMFLARLAPVLPLMYTYYWVIQRPSAAPLFAVFAIALIGDFWGESIVGVTALMALFLRLTLAPHQEVFRVAPFPHRWLAFAIVMVFLTALKWGIVSVMTLEYTAVRDLVFQGVVTVALYPLCNHLYALLDRRVIMRD